MKLVDAAVAAVAEAKEAKANLNQESGDRWVPALSIVGTPDACRRLQEAEGARSLWEGPPRGVDTRQVGRFAGVDVFAILPETHRLDIDPSLINVMLGARVVAQIDLIPVLPPALFLQVCQELWGEAWRSHAYGLFGIPDRTLRRFLDGTSPIPTGIARTILKALDKKQRALTGYRALIISRGG